MDHTSHIASRRAIDLFDMTGRVVVITGGAGLLGVRHARAIASAGGIPVLVDVSGAAAEDQAGRIAREFGVDAWGAAADISRSEPVAALKAQVLARHGRVDALINNAANNPKMESADVTWTRLENFSLTQWEQDLAVGLTGAFLCAQAFGSEMARRGSGTIVNVSSDLGVIAPDQRLYRQPGVPDDRQPVKPVTYSVVKTGLIGLTRYLATYWCDRGVRVNAISPGGVYNGQPDEFVQRLTSLIPLGRMADVDEYQGAILFLCSDASSYMTGANLIVDGGRSVW
jgi:NAD(P)-dependent dehydrogenase (short-subunit alcohol dehydrogenase family)